MPSQTHVSTVPILMAASSSWLTGAFGSPWIQQAARNKPKWPNPGESTGIELPAIHSVPCWDVIGPARECARILLPQITLALETNVQRLMAGEKTWPVLLVRMCMVGLERADSVPVFLLKCDKKAIRVRAKAIIKETKILDPFPEILLVAYDNAPSQLALAGETDATPEARLVDQSGKARSVNILSLQNPKRLHCLPLSFVLTDPDTQAKVITRSTMGGVITVDGNIVGLTVAHAINSEKSISLMAKDDTGDLGIEYDSDGEGQVDKSMTETLPGVFLFYI